MKSGNLSPRFRLYKGDWLILRHDFILVCAGFLALYGLNKLTRWDFGAYREISVIVVYLMLKAAYRFITDNTQQLKGGYKYG